MTALCLLLFAVVPQDTGVLEDRVDIIEDNQVYNPIVNDNGTVTFVKSSLRQLIFREKNHYGWQVVDWKVWTPECVPMEDSQGKYILWNDTSEGRCVLRMVRFLEWEKTETSFDNECWEREFFPHEWRRKLKQPRKLKP